MITGCMTPRAKLEVLSPNSSPEEVQSRFLECRFDVLPVGTASGILGYYQRNSTEVQDIGLERTIQADASYKDLLARISESPFLFVIKDDQVVGLITLADLNARSFRLWLYEHHFSLETALIDFLAGTLNEEKIIVYLEKKSQNRKDKCEADMFARYQTDKSKDIDCRVTEYLFFPDLINLIASNHLFNLLKEKSRTSFEKKYGPINDLRTGIMHPAKSIISSHLSPRRVLELVQRCENLLASLDSYLVNASGGAI